MRKREGQLSTIGERRERRGKRDGRKEDRERRRKEVWFGLGLDETQY